MTLKTQTKSRQRGRAKQALAGLLGIVSLLCTPLAVSTTDSAYLGTLPGNPIAGSVFVKSTGLADFSAAGNAGYFWITDNNTNVNGVAVGNVCPPTFTPYVTLYFNELTIGVSTDTRLVSSFSLCVSSTTVTASNVLKVFATEKVKWYRFTASGPAMGHVEITQYVDAVGNMLRATYYILYCYPASITPPAYLPCPQS